MLFISKVHIVTIFYSQIIGTHYLKVGLPDKEHTQTSRQ